MTPGVFINDREAFPNSIVGVPTDLPGFVGYTQKAVKNGTSVANKAILITSILEFIEIFGTEPVATFTLTKAMGEVADFASGDDKYSIEITEGNFNLYYSIQLFYANGGDSCYIVSVGNYADAWSSTALVGGISVLEKEQEVTLLVVPEAILAPTIVEYTKVITAMIHQAGQLKSRIAILDVYKGDTPFIDHDNAAINQFRDVVGNNYLSYAVAYFPFLNTTILTTANFSYKQLTNTTPINRFLYTETTKTIEGMEGTMSEQEINNYLASNSTTYKVLLKALQAKVNVLPPSPAMAGVYTLADSSRAVWKAPANINLLTVASPVVSINNEQQSDLNSTPDGKAINAIRNFVGQGVLVWGAKTMDSNSIDYRYINVRRTVIYIEQSIKNYCRNFVFEPNDANTWLTVKSGISNFLIGLWKEGALAGASSGQAYAVNVGLGTTMTAQDILNGVMVVNVMVAIVRPAEYIAIMIKQQMQTS